MPAATDQPRDSLPATDRVLHRSPHCVLGVFDLPAGHELWRTENRITLGPLIAIPWTPVVIDRPHARRELMDPSRVAFYRPQQAYQRKAVSPRGDRCLFIVPSPSLLRDALEHAGLGRDRDAYPFAAGPAVSAVTQAQHRLARALLGPCPPSPAEVDTATTRIVERLLEEAAREFGVPSWRARPRPAAHRDLVARARAVMNDRLEHGPEATLSINDLADRVESSPFHLARVFREQTGESPARHYRRLRLLFAAEAVGDPQAPLTGIALRFGFSSHAHFTAAWRAEFGNTPAAFRRARI